MSGLSGRVKRARKRIGARSPMAAVAVLALTITGSAVFGATRPAEATDLCHVSFAVSGSWPGGFTANVSITNLGSPITKWALSFDLPGDEEVSQNWNAVFRQSGRTVTASNGPYNPDLRTGQTTEIGFNGAYSTRSSPGGPTAFSLDATPCTSAVSSSPAPTANKPGLPGSPVPTPGASGYSWASGHLFESSQRFAQFRVGGGYAVSNNEWGSGYDTQTLWVDSAESWGLYATQPDTPGVKSYANIGTNLHASLDSLSSATSTFSETNPDGGNWESAYDLWLNGTGIEVMAWTYVSGDVQPLGYPVNTVTLDGSTWTLYVGDNGHNPTYSFVRHGNETSGTVDILSLLKYLEKTGGYFKNPVLSSIQYGWEIAGTGDVQKSFTMNEYSAGTS